eukprot:g11139.t1
MRRLLLGVVTCLLVPGATPRLGHEFGEGGTDAYGKEEGEALQLHTTQASEPLVTRQRHLSFFSWFSSRKKGQQAEGEEEGGDVGTKDYLNGLVAATAAKTSEQLANIAFMKTHKTASTTLAYLLFRYARRHKLKLAHFENHRSAIPLIEAVHQTEWGGKGRCDIMHYHISPFGQYDGTWEEAEQSYRKILRDSEPINFITVMREPRSHLLSYYSYYIQPQTKKSISEFLTNAQHAKDPLHRRLFNPLSAEFGVYKREDLDYMLNTGFPNHKLIILTEQFDEGLMVLRRLLGWEMVDMTYVSMYKTVDGAHRFDGKELVKSPPFDDLPEHVQQTIDDLTQMDRILYDAAQQEYEKRRDTVAEYLEADLAEFEQLQDVVKTYLHDNPSSKANVMNWAGVVGGLDGIVSTLLLRGAEKDALDRRGRTPLEWATSILGRLAIVKTLLDAGVDASIRGNDDFSALDSAAQKGHGHVVEVIVGHGADVNARDQLGYTALHTVSEYDQAGAVDALVKAGADVDVGRNNSLTPLATAAYNISYKALIALLRHGAKDEIDRTRLLLINASADRARRRRGWLIMLRSRDSKARAGKSFSSGGDRRGIYGGE